MGRKKGRKKAEARIKERWEEAEARIRKAIVEKETTIDLSKLELEEIPPILFDAVHVQVLLLYINNLSALSPEITRLQSLQELYLGGNNLSALPPEIAKLQSLRTLDLGGNNLSALPPEIASLQSLQKLYFGGNNLSALPPEIASLQSLQKLYLRSNNLSALPPEIAGLQSLQTLDLGHNNLSALPSEIARLQSLQELELSGNNLQTLPETLKDCIALKALYLHNNPALKLQPEVLGPSYADVILGKQTPASPKAILDYYFTSIKGETRPLNEAKVVLVGEGSVGKTSLVSCIMDGVCDRHSAQTKGILIRQWDTQINGQGMKLHFWDFGGQEIMHSTHQFFLTRRTLYVLVLDSRQDKKANRLYYWLKTIQSMAPDAPVLIVCNKCDQQHMDMDWKGLQQSYPQIRGVLRAVSCWDMTGIKDVISAISKEIMAMEFVSLPVPRSWFEVKEHFENQKSGGLDYIPIAKYRELCVSKGIAEDSQQDLLLEFLHDLGIMLHYGRHQILDAINVLNPKWVTEGVYAIITASVLTERRNGILNISDLPQILDQGKYPPAHQAFIIQMMKEFELCFELDGTKGKRYLIPTLLSEEAPDTGLWHDALRFQYKYDVLSGGIISRFIVRMHADVSNKTYWKNGVVIKSEQGNRALVQADEDQSLIAIAIDGPTESRGEFLAIIRATFRGIHNYPPIAGLQECVPLPDNPGISVSYEHLLRLKKLGESTFLPEKADRKYSVSELLGGIEDKTTDEVDRHHDMRLRRTTANVPAQTSTKSPLVRTLVVLLFVAAVGEVYLWKEDMSLTVKVLFLAFVLAAFVLGELKAKDIFDKVMEKIKGAG